MPPTEPVGGDAALGGGKIRRRMTVRQVCAKGRDKEELAHNEAQRNRAHAEQVLHGGIVPHHQMAGNGVQQHLKAAAGAVLGQHLDELNADHNVQAALQKGADLCLVAIEQQAGHPADQRHNAEQQTDQHQPGQQHFQQTGGLNNAVAQGGTPVAFYRVRGMFHSKTFLSAFCCIKIDKILPLL